MAKKITQTDMFHAVMSDDKMREEYYKQCAAIKISYSKHGSKINGKRVGIQRLVNTQKFIAQSVYTSFTKL